MTTVTTRAVANPGAMRAAAALAYESHSCFAGCPGKNTRGRAARLKEPKARNHSEPLSSIPLLEPKAQGSLNPLPRWKSGL